MGEKLGQLNTVSLRHKSARYMVFCPTPVLVMWAKVTQSIKCNLSTFKEPDNFDLRICIVLVLKWF